MKKLLTLLPVLLLTSCSLQPTIYNSQLDDMDIVYLEGTYYVTVNDKEFKVASSNIHIVVSNVDKVILVERPLGNEELYFYTTLNYGEE